MLNNVSVQNKVNFTAGLRNSYYKEFSQISVNQIEKYFLSNYNVQTNFLDNKQLAIGNFLILRIYEKLNKRYPTVFRVLTPNVYVFENNELINPNATNAFCIPDIKRVLKKYPPFEMRSIFFRQNSYTIKDIDDISEVNYNNKSTCSAHFLSSFLHEWIHNTHLDLLYRKYGYDGNSLLGKRLYNKKKDNVSYNKVKALFNTTFTDKEQELIKNYVGEYATLNPFEFFAETLTKFICDSLGNNLLPNESIFEKFNNYPDVFTRIFTKCL